MKLAPEQERVLKEILGSVALRLQVDLGISIETADAFLAIIKDVVPKITIRDQHYVLSLTTEKTGARVIDKKAVRQSLQAETPILVIDTAGRYVEAIAGKTTSTACCLRTGASKLFEILVSGSYIFYFLNGTVIEEIDTIDPGSQPVSRPRWSRRFNDLDGILRDHMNESVTGQKGFAYWKDRKKRILLSGPHGTERIFHHNLFWWIRQFAADALSVYAEPSGLGQNKTDINVVTSEGTHVIEVKWLGKNEKKTEHRQSRIDEGLTQVKMYLEGDEDLVDGHLVIYDGRSADDHQAFSDYNKDCQHMLCTEPRILFLENETPSESAPLLVNSLTPKKK